MRERRFAAGATVTQEGAGGAGFFVVEDGTADVTVQGQPRGSIGPGDYFGEIAPLTDRPDGDDRRHEGHAVLRDYSVGFRPLVETNSTIAWKLSW